MKYIFKLGMLLAVATAFCVVFSPLLTATLRDALLDFLDEQNTNKVIAYFAHTQGSRAIGMTILMMLWAVIVLAVDRLTDVVVAAKGRPTSQ